MAVVIRTGDTASSGHFYVVVREKTTNVWVEINDAKRTAGVDLRREEYQRGATLLVYCEIDRGVAAFPPAADVATAAAVAIESLPPALAVPEGMWDATESRFDRRAPGRASS